MAQVHVEPKQQSWLSKLMTTDFCPWANRFVYWLKEPIGWFVLATAVSVMVGLYVSPIGWTLAASLTAIIVTGMAWPWIAVRITHCGLHPEIDAVHEADGCRIVMSVRNRSPIPVWGLAVEGYLDCDSNAELMEAAKPTVALACVPPLCTADYSVSVTPPLRGNYPVVVPEVACSFPFGIWTARRSLQFVKPLTVWPQVFPIEGVLPISGQANADQGEGSRGGRSGDFVGVRAFRRGDSAKHVNWIASARCDSLIVTERGGPQSVAMEVYVNTSCSGGRESLARRVRVAASVLASLHQSRIETRVRLGNRSLAYGVDARGRRKMLDALAAIPADGEAGGDDLCGRQSQVMTHAAVMISGCENDAVSVRITNPTGGRRAGGSSREIMIAADDVLPTVVANLWKEVRDDDVAA